MATPIRGAADGTVEQVLTALGAYEQQHPRARVEVYRQNSVSIRVRIIDPDFAGVSRAERHEIVWGLIEKLPDAVQNQISLLLPLTPEEMGKSLANLEFENPAPSHL